MATYRKGRDLPALKVVDVNWTFFASSEGCNDTTKASGLSKER